MTSRPPLPAPTVTARAATITVLAIVTVGLLLSGAADDVERVPFSHGSHQDTDDTLVCIDCHDPSHTVSGKPTVKFAKCAECHDVIPDVLARVPSQVLSFPLDHRPHASAVACTTCHARRTTADDEKTPEHQLAVSPRTCFSCHANAEGAPREQACITCHQRNERRERPDTHASAGSSAWRNSHGARSLLSAVGAEHGQSCTLCHRESSCRSCHRVEEPRDHTAFWSERTHGIAASFNQQRCKTCHETGQCIGCHRATEPRNHTASWPATHGLVARSKSDTSCAVCHRPSFCIDCHRGGR